MAFSTLPLGYCTNVHPGRSLAEVEAGLDEFTVSVLRNSGTELAAGLWLARPVVTELLARPDGMTRFSERLSSRGLSCHTLNAFPFGNFHSDRVKENVYLPDWSAPERLAYTEDCARVLATLLPEDGEGSISTVPLAFKPVFEEDTRRRTGCLPDEFLAAACGQLVELARRLARLHGETGRLVRLAIEPEPLCLLETTAETLAFFEFLRARAADTGQGAAVETHLGVCYDVCHQAVEFEDVAGSIAALAAAGIRINKVHITCAIELERPAENAAGRAELARYVEPRYLHQTIGRAANGTVVRAVDLTRDLALEPDSAFREADAWRVHFHVPVDAERLGPLLTTRNDLRQALAAVGRLDYAPHLEVETYTWEVLPGGGRVDLVEGLTREVLATRDLLAQTAASLKPQQPEGLRPRAG
jgi:sugar phosphate isomerase/epimerase